MAECQWKRSERPERVAAGGVAQEMADVIEPSDVLVAVAFSHHARVVVTIAETAASRAVPDIAIADSELSPLAKDAAMLFTVPEEEYSFTGSLAAPMCPVQCLAVAAAARLKPGDGQTPRIRRSRDPRASAARPAEGE